MKLVVTIDLDQVLKPDGTVSGLEIGLLLGAVRRFVEDCEPGSFFASRTLADTSGNVVGMAEVAQANEGFPWSEPVLDPVESGKARSYS